MTACVVVPLHDVRWAANAEECLSRQDVGVRVVLVTNGAASGWTSDRWQTTPSGEGHAAAVNAGVEWARQRDHDRVVLMDSDDWYGPEYVRRVLEALGDHDYVGRRAVRTRLRDGSVHLFRRPGRCWLFGTVAFRVSAFVPVRQVLDNCHDWTRRMAESGAKAAPDHAGDDYLYVRHGDNAHWPATDVMVRAAWGDSDLLPRPSTAEILRDLQEAGW